MPDKAASYFDRNRAWVRPGDHVYNTPLPMQEEMLFQLWVQHNNVPFDSSANADYDMRGFWKALRQQDPRATSAIDQNDKQIHYPDFWKTPYHETFSAESQWADPTKAPRWNDKDQLVTPDGSVLFDDKAANKAKAKAD